METERERERACQRHTTHKKREREKSCGKIKPEQPNTHTHIHRDKHRHTYRDVKTHTHRQTHETNKTYPIHRFQAQML